MTTQRPLSKEEEIELAALEFEIRNRGLEIPKMSQDVVKDIKWRLGGNGYFLRADGKQYIPTEQQEAFIKSSARFVLFRGGRGCISGDTKINGVPVADRNSADAVSTLWGNQTATKSFLKGKDNLYSVTTQLGKRVRVTAQHRFLTPVGWLPLSQLSVGSLVLSDGTSSAGTDSQRALDYVDCYSQGFHLNDELYDLLEQVSLDILRRLHKIDGGNSAWSFHDLLSIVDFSRLTLFRFCVEYSLGLIGLEHIHLLLQTFLQSLDKIYRSYKSLQGCQEGTYVDFGTSHLYLPQFPDSLGYSQYSADLAPSYVRYLTAILQKDTSTVSQTSVGSLESFHREREFLSSARYGVGTQHLTYDKFFSMSLDLDQTLSQLGVHSGFLGLFAQSFHREDFHSSLVEKQIFQKILQLYVPDPHKCLETLKLLRQSTLPKFLDVFVRGLSFLDDLSYNNLLSISYKDNYSTQFDKVQDIKFDSWGDYYDLTVPSAGHYLAEGLYHHNSGKSAAGAQKAMFKVMQGEDGAVINPVFGDFKTSTWVEFKNWIDWSMVVPSQKHRRSDAWQPHQPFTMVFNNGAKVYCKGLKDPKSARGANINWLWYDEAASDETGMSWKIAIASVRVGKNPQAWATTTPKGTEHWVYKFFIENDIPQEAVDLLSKDDRILIETFKGSINDNKENLDPGFYATIISAFPSGWLRAQEVDGDFAAEGGKIGDRRWFDKTMRDDVPETVGNRVRFWDLAGTEKKQVKDDPDETVGTLLSKRKDDVLKKDIFCIEHQVAGWWAWEKLLDAIANTARYDGVDIPVVLEQEPGSGGKNQIAAVKAHFKTFPELAYHKVIGQDAKKVGDRVMAANHWFAFAAEGKFEMVRGSWNEKTLSQIDGFTQILHDDRVTSITGAFTFLTPWKTWARVPFLSIGSKRK